MNIILLLKIKTQLLYDIISNNSSKKFKILHNLLSKLKNITLFGFFKNIIFILTKILKDFYIFEILQYFQRIKKYLDNIVYLF